MNIAERIVGKGIDLAREADIQSSGDGLHADVLDDFKDQLMIVLLRRLADKNGHVSVPCGEIDATGNVIVDMNVDENRIFHFHVRRKQ